MKSKINAIINNGTCMQTIVLYIVASAVMASLAVTTGNAFGATSFGGKLREVTITDAGKVNAPPTPVLKYTLDGNKVMVDASSSSDTDGSIAGYSWDFGDGAKATGATISHQYGDTGSYPITLTVTDNSGGVGITQQQVDLSTVFYWSVDSLPLSTMVSDVGNVTISKYSKDATSAPGFKGNCMQQTGTSQAYKIPLTTVPTSKGSIRMYVRHDTASSTTDASSRYFFKSTNLGVANALYAYTYKGYIYFYVYDSAGTLHRTYGPVTWQVGQWQLYEFKWDAATGVLTVSQNGTNILNTTTTVWANALPSWTGQDLFFGYTDPIGSIDEISISL